MKYFRNMNGILNPVISLVVGILLLVNPRAASRTLVVVGGVLLLGAGLIMLLNSLTDHSGIRNPDLSGAVLNIVLGVFMALFPSTAIRLVCTVVGVYMLLDGIIGVSSSIGMMKVLHVVTLVLGILLLFNPLHTVFSVMQLAGIGMMVDGAVGLATGSNIIHRN